MITFHQISLRPVVVEEWEYHHSTRLDELVRMVVFHSFTTTGCRLYWQNIIKLAFLSLRHLTFRQISRRPVAIEEWEYHHSNRLIETSRMVVFPFFYDHWMPSLLAKCHQIGIITFDTAPFDISSNISTSSGRGRMGIPPFDSSR